MTDRSAPADLQPAPAGALTIADAAEAMNVSERQVYLARAVMRLRPDLVPEIEAGRLSINAAYRLANGKAAPDARSTTWDRLVAAWNAASEEDQARFIVQLRSHIEMPTSP